MLTPNSEIQVIVVPGDATNISAILDTSAGAPTTPFLSFFKVAQG
jgi:hypothetical protein